MPSASNVKVEKPINLDAGLAEFTNNASTPLRQAITVIEHKIRNLEKRKAKLESYKELQNSGKELNNDQKVAVAKYDEVLQTLEFARELCKQFIGIAVVTEKEAKKTARKENVAKSQAELAKIREVLLVQDALNQMGQDSIRDDFLLGRNGAIVLSESDLKLLDDFYPAVTPKHESGVATAFTNQVQAAAEHLLAVVDGKPKEAFGSTYSQIKEVIGKIHESGYLDQAMAPSEEEPIEVVDTNSCNEIVPEELPQQDESLHSFDTLNVEPSIPPAPMQVDPPVEPIVAEPQVFYQQPHPRPIAEMLGGGSFFFLQDSELDTPDTLPSQTFTNTNYVQAPPPPIPLPPNFQPYQQPVNLGSTPRDNGIDEPPVQQSQLAQPTDTTAKHRGQARPNSNNNNNNNQQPYYNNNSNNYNGNRPRPNRNNQNRSGSRQH